MYRKSLGMKKISNHSGSFKKTNNSWVRFGCSLVVYVALLSSITPIGVIEARYENGCVVIDASKKMPTGKTVGINVFI